MVFPSHQHLVPDTIHTWKHNASVNGPVAFLLTTLQPRTVVDVGAGDGFYGKLIRHLLPDTTIDGIEIDPEYIRDFDLVHWYDNIVQGNLLDVLPYSSADLIIFGDVLEHLSKWDALQAIRVALARSRYVLICGPYGFQPQDHVKPQEHHRCGLTEEDLTPFQIELYLRLHQDGEMMLCLLRGELP